MLYIYIGGERLILTDDSGSTWKNITNLFFDTIPGPVIGARDCSGTIYIGPDGYDQEMLRSTDQGRFFQDAGQVRIQGGAPLLHMRKGEVFDRGSTIFY